MARQIAEWKRSAASQVQQAGAARTVGAGGGGRTPRQAPSPANDAGLRPDAPQQRSQPEAPRDPQPVKRADGSARRDPPKQEPTSKRTAPRQTEPEKPLSPLEQRMKRFLEEQERRLQDRGLDPEQDNGPDYEI